MACSTCLCVNFPDLKSEPALAMLAVKETISWKSVLGKAKKVMLKHLPCDIAGAVIPDEVEEFKCDSCDASFPTEVQKYSHMCKKHGYVNPLRRKVITTHCVSCMRCFHTRSRVFAHVAYRSKTCKAYYLQHVEDAPKEAYEHFCCGRARQ